MTMRLFSFGRTAAVLLFGLCFGASFNAAPAAAQCGGCGGYGYSYGYYAPAPVVVQPSCGCCSCGGYGYGGYAYGAYGYAAPYWGAYAVGYGYDAVVAGPRYPHRWRRW